MSGDRGPGRPRVWPAGTTASDRKRVQRQRDVYAGGHRLDLELTPAAWVALQQISAPGERTARINQLIMDEALRISASC